jgi:hypothetical protein
MIGYKPDLLPMETSPSNNKTAENRIKTLMENHIIATDAINQSTKGNGTILKQYHIGDLVYLKGKHLRFPHQAIKLNPKWYGPFKIIREISSVAYQLQLPLSWKLHPMFHASHLSPYSKTPAHSPNFS